MVSKFFINICYFSILEGKVVKLMRYNDTELGPRLIPNCEKSNEGTSTISLAATFNINLELQKVTLHENGGPIKVGSQMLYNII